MPGEKSQRGRGEVAWVSLRGGEWQSGMWSVSSRLRIASCWCSKAVQPLFGVAGCCYAPAGRGRKKDDRGEAGRPSEGRSRGTGSARQSFINNGTDMLCRMTQVNEWLGLPRCMLARVLSWWWFCAPNQWACGPTQAYDGRLPKHIQGGKQ